MSPEAQTLHEKLLASASRIEAAATEVAAALLEASELGGPVRQTDADFVRNRLFEALPYQMRFKAGGLLPPITGTLLLRLNDAKIEAG